MNHCDLKSLINLSLATLVSYVICSSENSFGQSFLDGVRSEVSGSHESSSGNGDQDGNAQNDHDHDDEDHDRHNSRRRRRSRDYNYFDDCHTDNSNFVGNIAGAILGETLKAGFRTACFCPPPNEDHPQSEIVFRGFQPYPYFDREFGRFCVDIEQTEYRHYSRQLSAEWLVSDRQVDTLRTRMLLESINRFGVDSEFAYLRQRPGGNDLYLGDVNAIYRFSQHANMNGRIGIGLNYLADNSNWNSGFNFTYGGDIFLAKPLVLSADIDWGTLGSTNLFHGRTTLGVIHRHTELYAGYDYLSIGAPKQHSFVAGLRFWF